MQKRTGGILAGVFGEAYVPYTVALSSENTWMAFGFDIDGSGTKTLSKVKATFSAVTTPAADITVTAELYSGSSGVPGTSLDGPQSITTPVAGVNEWTGFDYVSITPGTQYWIVFKNASGDPANDYPTVRYFADYALSRYVAGNAKRGNAKNHSTDGGSTWPNGRACAGPMRIEFSDGTFAGQPFSYVYGGSGTGSRANKPENQVGVRFTTPPYASMKVAGVSMFVYTGNSPTGNLSIVLRHGSTTAESLVIPNAHIGSGGIIQFYFSSVQTIPPHTDVIVLLKNDTTESSEYKWFSICEYTVFDDAGSKALLPFADGTATFWQKAYTTDGGSSFSYDSTSAPMMALILDSGGAFAVNGRVGRWR